MMRRVAAGRDVCDVDNGAEGVLRTPVSKRQVQSKADSQTSSRLTVAKKSLCKLSPAPVQK
jgi:hypothetical protein